MKHHKIDYEDCLMLIFGLIKSAISIKRGGYWTMGRTKSLRKTRQKMVDDFLSSDFDEFFNNYNIKAAVNNRIKLMLKHKSKKV